MVQSRGNKSRELYDIRQDNEFGQNKGKKIYREMLVSMQKFQSTTDKDGEFKGQTRSQRKECIHDVGGRQKKIHLGIDSECFQEYN